MGAISDLWNSERGLLTVLILVAATVLVVFGRMTIDQWMAFVQVVIGIYVAGKTVSSAVIAWKNPSPTKVIVNDPVTGTSTLVDATRIEKRA